MNLARQLGKARRLGKAAKKKMGGTPPPHFFFLGGGDKIVELVRGEPIINGAYPV